MPPPAVRRMLRLGRCAQLQPIPCVSGAQRALLPIAVGAMNINDLMNINDVRASATIFPRPYRLNFDLFTLKVVVTWATCVPILVLLGLSVLELFPMYATDRRRTKASLSAPAYGAGHNKQLGYC